MNTNPRSHYRVRRFAIGLALSSIVGLSKLDAYASSITLGTAGGFAVLGGSGVSNTGSSVIGGGDVGASPTGTITGFPPGLVTPPYTFHAGDAAAAQAQSDLTSAYNVAAGLASNTDLTGSDLGGLILVPGVYTFSSSAQLTGILTLNYGGNPDAEFIFQIGSTLTTASGSSVVAINVGLNPDPDPGCNVFWQVGSSATLGTSTAFAGHILALTSITLTTGVSIDGSALARNGEVTLDNNRITNHDCDDTSRASVPEAGNTLLLLTCALVPVFGLKARVRRTS